MIRPLTIREIVLQSQRCHPDWNPEIHLSYLEQINDFERDLEYIPSLDTIRTWMHQHTEVGLTDVDDRGYPKCRNTTCEHRLCWMDRRDWEECPDCGHPIPRLLRVDNEFRMVEVD